MARHGRPAPRRHARTPVVLLGTVLALLAVVVYVVGERRVADQAAQAGHGHAVFDDTAAVDAVIKAAGSDVAVLYAVDHRRLAADLAAGTAVSTGDYQDSYRATMTGTLRTQALRTDLVRTFAVQRAGISALSADGTNASAMVFGLRRDVTSGSGAAGTVTGLTVGMSLRRIGGRWLVSMLREGAGPQTTPPGDADLAAAVDAARSEVQNVLSYSRDSYDADVAQALAGATGELRGGIQAGRQATLEAMNSGGYDLVGQIRGVAVESADGDIVSMIVCADAERVNGSGSTPITLLSRLGVTVESHGGRWLVSQVDPVTT